MSSPGLLRREVSTQKVVYMGAVLSVIAALFHVWVMLGHFEEWWGFGALFLVLAASQGFYSVALLNWPRLPLVLVGGIAGNLSIIVLYSVTRTVGIPFFGPHAGEVEPVHALDVASKMVEAGLVIALVILAWSWWVSNRTRVMAQI